MERLKTPRSGYKIPKKRPSKRSRAGKLIYERRKKSCLGLNTEQCGSNVSASVDNILLTSSAKPTNVNSNAYSEQTNNLSTTERKINAFSEFVPTSAESHVTDAGGMSYILVHVSVWDELMKGVLCSICKTNTVKIQFRERHGYCSKLVVKCEACENVSASVYSSPRIDNQTSQRPQFHVNKCMVEAINNLGSGHSGLQKFSMTMEMLTLDIRAYARHLQLLVDEGNIRKTEILQMASKAVRKAHTGNTDNNEIIDIACPYDATWQKRGHTSNYGIGFIIDILTGIVLDYEIFSKYCLDCTVAEKNLGKNSTEYDAWYTAHSVSDCQKNYRGSSNAMEKDIAEIPTSVIKIGKKRDFKRNVQSKKRSCSEEKQTRKVQKWQKIAQEERKKKSEGETYSAGQF